MSFFDLIARADRTAQRVLGGVPVVYTPQDGAPVTVTGIFDAQYLLIESGETRVEGRHPAVFLRLSDLPTDPDQDEPTVTIGAKEYRVTERRPDGLGGVLLVLLEVT